MRSPPKKAVTTIGSNDMVVAGDCMLEPNKRGITGKRTGEAR